MENATQTSSIKSDFPGPDRLLFAKNFADKLNESRLWKIKISYQKRWTKHRRTQKSLEIRMVKPWLRATGPKRLAVKHTYLDKFAKQTLKEHGRFLRQIRLLCRIRTHAPAAARQMEAECLLEAQHIMAKLIILKTLLQLDYSL